MARTAFVPGNPAGVEKGPVLVAENTEISAVEVAEQFGFGLVDVRLHFRNTDGTSIPGSPVTGWCTGLIANANATGEILVPQDEVFAGLVVVEQAGFGVVNVRVKKRKRSNGEATPDSVLALANQNQNAVHELLLPANASAEGIVCREQAGFGVIAIAIDFKEPGS